MEVRKSTPPILEDFQMSELERRTGDSSFLHRPVMPSDRNVIPDGAIDKAT